ncbi:hypothetical protein [Kitasatospora sp. NPDC098663]
MPLRRACRHAEDNAGQPADHDAQCVHYIQQYIQYIQYAEYAEYA